MIVTRNSVALRHAAALALVAVVSIAGGVTRPFAHEGHDDGPAAPGAGAVGAVPPHPTHTAITHDLEIVARHEPLAPGVGEALNIYVNDFASNAPVGGAQIEARLASAERGTAWIGTLVFAVVLDVTGSYRGALLSLLVLFAAGGALLARTDTAAAVAAAARTRLPAQPQ